MGRRGSQRGGKQVGTHRPAGNPVTTRLLIEDMTPEEMGTWLAGLREQLQRKQQREQAYLDRRAQRGTYTPTDEAYELDQTLETDLIALLDHLIAAAARHKGNTP